MRDTMDRRGFLAAATGFGVAAAAGPATALGVDLRKPADNVTTYLRMRASIATEDVYYWISGRLDLAVAGEPIRPIIDVESLNPAPYGAARSACLECH